MRLSLPPSKFVLICFGFVVACTVYNEDLLETGASGDGTGGSTASSGSGGSSSSSGSGGSSSSSGTASSSSSSGSSTSSSSSTTSSSSSSSSSTGSPPTVIYETSFEAGEPAFEKVSGSGTFSNDPPPGTTARTGSQVITNSSITTQYDGRAIQSVDCIPIDDSGSLLGTIYGEASSFNGGNAIYGRIKMLWFTDATCTTPHATADESGSGVVLPQGSYIDVTFDELPPTGATHAKVRFEVHDNNGDPNDEDDWAADDVALAQ